MIRAADRDPASTSIFAAPVRAFSAATSFATSCAIETFDLVQS